MAPTISLREATESGRLPEFIAQEEARLKDYAPADRKEVEKGIAALVKAPQSADRTSRSSSRGGSSGT